MASDEAKVIGLLQSFRSRQERPHDEEATVCLQQEDVSASYDITGAWGEEDEQPRGQPVLLPEESYQRQVCAKWSIYTLPTL